MTSLRAIVPAGGAGTRLWPLSRADSPKFLHDLTGTGRTLLQATVDRLRPLTGPDGVMIVTGAAHEDAVRDQLPDLAEPALVAEPSPRNSMAAIGLAAAILHRREGEVVVGSFAADHVVVGDGFARAVTEAVAAAEAGYVVAVGITATGPSIAYGYVQAGASLDLVSAPTARVVRGFTEKPDAARAQRYIESGDYRWNAGMFLARTSVLLDHLSRLRPALHAGLARIADAWDTPARAAVLAEVWPGLESVAIDHAIAEPVAADGGMAMVPGEFTWADVGDFASLAALLPADPSGATVLGPGEVLTVDAAGGFVVPDGRTVVLAGVDDVVVVSTPDVLLVTTRAQAQRLSEVVQVVRAARPDLA